MKIAQRYILRSVITPLLVNLLFFTFIFLMGKMLKITKLIINYQVDAGVIGFHPEAKVNDLNALMDFAGNFLLIVLACASYVRRMSCRSNAPITK